MFSNKLDGEQTQNTAQQKTRDAVLFFLSFRPVHFLFLSSEHGKAVCFGCVVQRKIFLETYQIKPNLDCNYTFPIDLTSNEILFDAKLIGIMRFQSKFGLNQQYSEKKILTVWNISSEKLNSKTTAVKKNV